MQDPKGSCNCNVNNLNLLSSNNWKTSLVPAHEVIPAPVAYTDVVAVKTLVVDGRVGVRCGGAPSAGWGALVYPTHVGGMPPAPSIPRSPSHMESSYSRLLAACQSTGWPKAAFAADTCAR